MKRFWIGAGFLGALLACGIWVSCRVGQITEPVVQELKQAEALALEGRAEQARLLAEQARQNWLAHWQTVACFADHSPMEEIDSRFAELEAYGSLDETGDFAAACAALSRQVEAMAQAHAPNWWNLL